MTHSLYEELVKAEKGNYSQQQVKDLLVDLGIAYIFDQVIEKHWSNGWFNPIVFYAAHCYCWETKMVRLGGDFRKAKLTIATRVKLPIEAYDAVIDLKDETITRCFNRFLMLYKDNFDYVDLTNRKELYQQFFRDSSSFKSDEEGNADMEAKERAAKNADKLAREIKSLEKELFDKYRILNPAQQEFAEIKGNPLAFENNPHIKRGNLLGQ
jgi:hypothetical protein